MNSIILTEPIKYDGSQIAPLWAYSMGIKGAICEPSYFIGSVRIIEFMITCSLLAL